MVVLRLLAVVVVALCCGWVVARPVPALTDVRVRSTSSVSAEVLPYRSMRWSFGWRQAFTSTPYIERRNSYAGEECKTLEPEVGSIVDISDENEKVIRLRIVKRLGIKSSNTYGEVWSSEVVGNEHVKYALKMQAWTEGYVEMIYDEYDKYKALEKVQSGRKDVHPFPKVLIPFVWERCRVVLPSQQLGPTLWDELVRGHRFGFLESFSVSIKLLKLFEIMHSTRESDTNYRLVHTDIKADNVLYDYGKKHGSLHIIDLGNARWSEEHPYLAPRPFKAPHATLRTMNGALPTRLDDLEQMGYMLIYLVCRWVPLKPNGRSRKIKQNLLDKDKPSPFCNDLPPVYLEFLRKVMTMDVVELEKELPYQEFIELFKKAEKEHGKREQFANPPTTHQPSYIQLVSEGAH